jgi:hypothetical protein
MIRKAQYLLVVLLVHKLLACTRTQLTGMDIDETVVYNMTIGDSWDAPNITVIF